MELIPTFITNQPIPVALLAAVVIMILRGDLVPKSVVKEKDELIQTLLDVNKEVIEANQKLLKTAETTDKLLVTINKTAGETNAKT